MLLALLACKPATVEPPEDSPTPLPQDSAVHDTAEPIGGDAGLLPVLSITLDTTPIPEDEKVGGQLEVIRPQSESLDGLDDDVRTLITAMGIQIHGSSSTGYPKKGFRIELRDAFGADLPQTIVGMPPGSDFVLHAPYSDKTLVRNALAYTLARSITDAWHPRSQLVELFIDDDYQGVYLLVERVRRDDDRVDLPAPADSPETGDITGGYIVRIEQHRNEGWDTARGTPIDYFHPRYDDLTPEQRVYLHEWFNGFEDDLAEEGWQALWPHLIETRAWVDHFLINELANNVDAYRLSAYLFKEPDADGGRLHAGPVWDFDRAFGNVNYCGTWATTGFVIDHLTTCGYGHQYPFWWKQLLSDPAFTEALQCRWQELREDELSSGELLNTLTALVQSLEHAEPRDHQVWSVLGEDITPNYQVFETYDEEVEFLGAWVVERARWLDDHLPGECSE